MRRIPTLAALFAATLLASGSALAQLAPPDTTLRSEKLAEGLYVLFGNGGNMALSVGEDATFLVDDQFAPMTQAAIHGLGVALLPDFLADPEIAEGRLCQIGPERLEGTGSYWLVWPEERAGYPPLAAFRDWIAGG